MATTDKLPEAPAFKDNALAGCVVMVAPPTDTEPLLKTTLLITSPFSSASSHCPTTARFQFNEDVALALNLKFINNPLPIFDEVRLNQETSTFPDRMPAGDGLFTIKVPVNNPELLKSTKVSAEES